MCPETAAIYQPKCWTIPLRDVGAFNVYSNGQHYALIGGVFDRAPVGARLSLTHKGEDGVIRKLRDTVILVNLPVQVHDDCTHVAGEHLFGNAEHFFAVGAGWEDLTAYHANYIQQGDPACIRMIVFP